MPVAQKPTNGATLTVRDVWHRPIWHELRLGVLSARGKGKTHLALTASKFYVENNTPQTPIALSDIFIIEGDQGGLLPAREQGYTVPHLDLSELSDDDLYSQWPKIPGLVRAEVEKRGTRCVIVDPLSTMADALAGTAQKRDKTPRVWTTISRDILDFMRRFMELPCAVVFTAHISPPKALIAASNEDKGTTLDEVRAMQEAQAVAKGLERGELPIMLPGESAKRQASAALVNIAHLRVKDLPGGKQEHILDFHSKEVESKARLSRVVGREEPAHLNKLFAKIAQGLGASEL